MLQTFLAIVFSTCCTIGSQLLVKGAVIAIKHQMPATHGVDWLLAVISAPRIWMAVAIQGAGFLVWAWVVSRMKLGVAFATAGAFFYILLAAASWALYGERLTGWQWAGILLVSAGVVLMTATQGT